MKFQGIVLAGGKSSRFGDDKAKAEINGVTLLEFSARLIWDLGLEPMVITNDARDYSFLNCQIEKDIIPGKGPLGGLYTACQKFPDHPLLVLTCDMPAVTLESLRILLEYYDDSNQVTLFKRNDGQLQPFPGIYQSTLSELLLKNIQMDALSVQYFLSSLPRVHAVSYELGSRILFNINEKEDLNLWLNFS